MIPRLHSLLFLYLASAFVLRSQSTAALSGRVIDPSGRAANEAGVSVLEVNQNVSRHTETNALGEFFVPLLQPGRYSITIQKNGFEITEIRNVVLAAGDGVHLAVHMEVGRLRQSIEVGALGSGIQPITSTLSTLITDKAVHDLPLNGRYYVDFGAIVRRR